MFWINQCFLCFVPICSKEEISWYINYLRLNFFFFFGAFLLLCGGKKNTLKVTQKFIFMTADTSGGYERCLHSFPFFWPTLQRAWFWISVLFPLFLQEEQASLASALFYQAIAQGPPLRHFFYKQFWEARGQSGRELVQRGICGWQNSDSSVHSREGSPVVYSAAGPKENTPAPLSTSPSLVGVSLTGPPHSSGSADGPTLREAAGEEFIWADLQRKTIDSSGLVKSISSIQNIIQRIARWTSWSRCHQRL